MKSAFALTGMIAATVLATSQVQAHPVTASLYYTTHTDVAGSGLLGATNYQVWNSTLKYNPSGGVSCGGPVSTFCITTPYGIGNPGDADGIAQNPQNSNLLIIGGASSSLYNVNKTTGVSTAYSTPGGSDFHLEIDTPTHGYATGIPSATVVQFTIGPTGTLTPGPNLTATSGSSAITQIIDTPYGYYFTNAGTGGGGSFGKISFGATTYTTSTLLTGLASAHGGTYDPFTGDIMLFGGSSLQQIDIGSSYASPAALLSSFVIAGRSFDQGTVDGLGHLFVASNTGHIAFLDYSATGLIGSPTFSASPFLITNLDDVAPLAGEGSTAPSVPVPSAIALFAIGLFGLGATKQRKVAA